MFIEELNLLTGANIKPGLFNVFIGGNGVGKTTLGTRLATKLNMVYIDHDAMKDKVSASFLDCSISRLDLHKCLLKSLELQGHPKRFMFALGGDSRCIQAEVFTS